MIAATKRPAWTPQRQRDCDSAAGRGRTFVAQEISHLLGKPKKPHRRRKAMRSFRAFCETYFPERFCDPWSEDHIRVMATMEKAALSGGKFALAMPRGSGKTSLVEACILYAILKGVRKFGCLIGATAEASVEMLQSIKKVLSDNETLRDDFQKEVKPFALLEDESRKCGGQRFKGKKTGIKWLADRVVFAWIPGSKAAGAVIRVAGITGRIHGMKHTNPDGRVIRPEFVVLDDPQTLESAGSKTQTEQRERIISSGVLGLAGPRVQITAVMLCTVFLKDDLADRFLNRDTHPEWQGERTKTLYAFPENMEMWKEYKRIWTEEKQTGGDGSAALEFYQANREEMDRGAQPAWVHRYKAGEVSAIQSAMHSYLFDRAAFMSNAQNDPEDNEVAAGGRLDPRAVAERWNGRPAAEVPLRTEWITAAVDVHDDLLYYTVLAIEGEFSGSVIEYGTWPRQSSPYFSLSGVESTLGKAYSGTGREGGIYSGLCDLLGRLLGSHFRRDDGQTMSIGLCLVDSGYVADIVGKVQRSLNRGPQLMPSKGYGIGAGRKPLSEYKREAGVRVGQHYRIAPAPVTRLATCNIDTNWWKSFARDRLKVPVGDPGAITLFGERADQHRLWADHAASEIPVETSGPWGKVEDWKREPNRDNHYWDTFVYALAAGAVLGAKMDSWSEQGRRQIAPIGKRMSLSKLGK